METINPEALQKIDSVPAREVFASADEIEANTHDAIDRGIISVEVLPENADRREAEISSYINLSEQDIDVSKLDDKDKRYKSGQFEDFVFNNPDEILERSKDELHRRVAERTFYDNEWHIGEPMLEKDIEEGAISELYDLQSEDKDIKLINFTEQNLTVGQLNMVKDVVSKIAAVSGNSVFEATNAICFLKSDRFNGKVVGTARGMSGVIILNESLINGEVDEEYLKFKDIDITPLESTLTHELGHLVELKDSANGAYAAATGWIEDSKSFTDDYGNAQTHRRAKLEEPFIIKVDDNGKLVDAKITDKYDRNTISNAKPVTDYGYTNQREDFAEAFVPYVHTDRDNTGALDSIRRDAITGVLQRGAIEHGPFNVVVEKLPLTHRIGDTIKERHYKVAEPIYSYNATFNERTNKPEMPKTVEEMYTKDSNTFVDDYGNQVTHYGGHVPKTW